MDRRLTQPARPMKSRAQRLVAAGAALAIGVAAALALGAAAARADDPPKKPEKPEVRDMSGISILGNQDAPKALVIVPWKSSELGNGIGISSSMNNRPVPVDKDVFGRQLHYFDLRKVDPSKAAAAPAN